MEKDIYESFAEVYDEFYQRHEDIDFYVKMAKKYGDPILELACGTGRVLLPIAKAGYNITGLDNSESMLKVLKKKLEREDEAVRRRVTIVKGDMRSFDLGKKFKLIIMPFSSIVHILTLEDALQTFKNIWKHLEEDGVYVMDTFIPNLEIISKKERTTFDIRETEDGKIILWESAKYDLTNQYIEVKRYTEIQKKEGIKKATWKVKIRYWFKTEIELLLKQAKFSEINTYSSYDLTPYNYEKNPMIIIAKK